MYQTPDKKKHKASFEGGIPNFQMPMNDTYNGFNN